MGPAHPNSGLVVLPKELSAVSMTNTTPPPIAIKPIKLFSKGEDNTIPLYIACDDKHPVMVVELVKFAHTHGSWVFVPKDSTLVPEFCKNGNLTFVTKVDPLFVILLVMDCNSKSANADAFQPLDALCTTEDGMNLSNLTSEQQISLLCDSKVAGDESFFRLNEEKALSWITRKHELLSQHAFVNAQNASDIISQYLNKRWTVTFRNSLEAQGPVATGLSDTESPADLAMSIMMNDAKENNITACMPQPSGKRKQSRTNNTTPSKKKKEVDKGAAKWWASKRSSRSNGTAPSRKKTLRSSTTK